ncbi:MAG TPA: NEW3 domain-containing protein [Stellaceae bacterium]|nr:NEW3 domain-containing protein [Stellaceae bacterium]
MVRRLVAALLMLILPVGAVHAAGPAGLGITGIFVTTKYPTLTIRAGETTTLDLSVHNFKLPPELLQLSLPQVAPGWKAQILGGGQPIGAVEVAPDSEEALQLRLDPPAGAQEGDYHFVVEARNAQYDEKLPITIAIGKEVPAKLKLTTDFPALRGTSTTAFKYTMTVTNDSGRDATVNLSAETPKNFQASFTEAYGSQQITSIPIKAGSSKDVDASLALPSETKAGDYKLVLRAKTAAASASLPVSLTIVGQPQLSVSGEGGRLSGDAYAGRPSQLTVVLHNDGSAAARDIALSAATPEDWKSSFDPQKLPELPPDGRQEVKVTLTPSSKAIAGDYQTTITADSAGGLSDSANFRITVLTSTLWGAVAIGIIAAALLVVVFAVARFGRR